jgi:hypothetical protein
MWRYVPVGVVAGMYAATPYVYWCVVAWAAAGEARRADATQPDGWVGRWEPRRDGRRRGPTEE